MTVRGSYFDDIALFGDHAEGVQDALDNIDRELRINASKTKVISTQSCPGAQHTIHLGGVLLEEVESFKYLGSSFLLTYLGRHSPGSGCAGINGNNRVPNCRCPSSAILRPGDPDRHPVPVPLSEAVDGRSTEAGEILLHRGHPRFELAATLLAPMHWGLGVDDLADGFAGRTSRSMPEPKKSTLFLYSNWSG